MRGHSYGEIDSITSYRVAGLLLWGLSVDLSICMRPNIVFDASAHWQPVKVNKHWGDMIGASRSRNHSCTCVL